MQNGNISGVGALLLVGLALFGFVKCTEPPDLKAATDPKAVVYRLVDWQPGDRARAVFRRSWDNADVTAPKALAYGLHELGEWLAADPSRMPARTLTAALQAELADRYGNTSVADVLVMEWSAEDLRQVKWASVSPRGLVALGKPVVRHPAAAASVASWCREHSGSRLCEGVR